MELTPGPGASAFALKRARAPALRAKVFERVYRIPWQDQEGTGLGLAIAERAAAKNGATIRFATGAGGQGLAVIIDFYKENHTC